MKNLLEKVTFPAALVSAAIVFTMMYLHRLDAELGLGFMFGIVFVIMFSFYSAQFAKRNGSKR